MFLERVSFTKNIIDSDDGKVPERDKRKTSETTEIIQTEKMHCVAGPSKVSSRAFVLVVILYEIYRPKLRDCDWFEKTKI